jgi:hypothetical protein
MENLLHHDLRECIEQFLTPQDIVALTCTNKQAAAVSLMRNSSMISYYLRRAELSHAAAFRAPTVQNKYLDVRKEFEPRYRDCDVKFAFCIYAEATALNHDLDDTESLDLCPCCLINCNWLPFTNTDGSICDQCGNTAELMLVLSFPVNTRPKPKNVYLFGSPRLIAPSNVHLNNLLTSMTDQLMWVLLQYVVLDGIYEDIPAHVKSCVRWLKKCRLLFLARFLKNVRLRDHAFALYKQCVPSSTWSLCRKCYKSLRKTFLMKNCALWEADADFKYCRLCSDFNTSYVMSGNFSIYCQDYLDELKMLHQNQVLWFRLPAILQSVMEAKYLRVQLWEASVSLVNRAVAPPDGYWRNFVLY